MNLPPMLRVREPERFKVALLLAPFAVFFLTVGIVCGIDYLREIHFRGPSWVIPFAVFTAVHVTVLGFVYLVFWHRCRSHVSVQGMALLGTFLLATLAGITVVIVVGVH